MRDKIVVIGSLNYDIILKSERLPACGETMPVDSATFSAGGKGANQAVQAAKLGAKTYMVGCIGKDAHGEELIQSANKYKLNTAYVKRVDEPTGMGIVNALSDGCVHANIVRGANFAITKKDIDAVELLLKETATVIFQMEIPLEINKYAMEKAKACGCRVLLNAAPSEPVPKEYLQLCDLLVVNEVEAAFYLGEEMDTVEKAKAGAAKMAAEYDADIIMTLGAAGAVVCDQGKITFIPSRKVDAIESTGAGDSFIGGTAYALMLGMNLTEACRFATCCSSITVCRVGAQDSMPTLEEVKAIYYN